MSVVRIIVAGLAFASLFSIALALRPKSSEATGAACPACLIEGEPALQLTERPAADSEACAACESAALPMATSASASGDADSGAIPAPAASDPAPTSRERIAHANDKNFASIFRQASGMVLVDFLADWCGPCQVQGQILEQLALSQEDVTIIKVNVDDSPVLARQLDISSIPTLLAFRDRVFLTAHVGVASEETITKMFHEQQASASPSDGE